MQLPTLEKLLLTENELEEARRRIEEIAYTKWQQAGCPENRSLDFWNEAEIEWIEYFYVPDRVVGCEKMNST